MHIIIHANRKVRDISSEEVAALAKEFARKNPNDPEALFSYLVTKFGKPANNYKTMARKFFEYYKQNPTKDSRSKAERLAAAKTLYEAAMRRASDPSARAEAKENYEHTVKAIEKETGDASPTNNRILDQIIQRCEQLKSECQAAKSSNSTSMGSLYPVAREIHNLAARLEG